MDTKIPAKEVELLESMVDREKLPSTFNYLLLHGLNAGMSPWNLTSKYATTEEVYAVCLKEKVKWEDLIDAPPDDVLL